MAAVPTRNAHDPSLDPRSNDRRKIRRPVRYEVVKHAAIRSALVLLVAVVAACSIEPERGEAPRAATETTKTTASRSETTSTTVSRPASFEVALRLRELSPRVAEPVAIATRAGTEDFFVASRTGRVTRLTRRVRYDRQNRKLVADPIQGPTFGTLTRRPTTEDALGGLVSIAFSFDGRKLYSSEVAEGSLVVRVHEVEEDRVDSRSETRLFELEVEDVSRAGGWLTIGRDGFLYVGVGDGGPSGERSGAPSDESSLLGSLLRIDPEVPVEGTPFSIPASNPWVRKGGAAPALWLKGVRLPWRFSFDRERGDLWLVDVGDRVQEINHLPADDGAGRGGNLGWPRVEGRAPEGTELPVGYREPIHVLETQGGCRIVGGFPYRGRAIPELVGTYVFSDTCSGVLRGLYVSGGDEVTVEPLNVGTLTGGIATFAEDRSGELFVATVDGRIFALERA
ncbi:MAG: hypothetical protein KatS3mg008_1595 [Acidimicrobiales bacterium]|nr:MAG: hypothetical protein KatS3mg008_1595 [Acidimicrobiales bacterium]